MKTILLVGSKDKSSFSLFLSEMLASYDYKVLVIDSTVSSLYKYSYTDMDNENINSLGNVDILTGSGSWEYSKSSLSKEGIDWKSYDCIIVDTDSKGSMLSDWPDIEEVLYISDNDMNNINRDVSILNRFMDERPDTAIRRIHFNSSYKVNSKMINLLMNERIEFSPFSKEVDFDQVDHNCMIEIQNSRRVVMKRIGRGYRSTLKDIASEWFDIKDKEFFAKLDRKMRRKDKNENTLIEAPENKVISESDRNKLTLIEVMKSQDEAAITNETLSNKSTKKNKKQEMGVK